MNARILLLLPLLCIAAAACMAQTSGLPDSTLRKIDRLFDTWNKPGSPGCAVAIVRNDTVLFAKGYGLANLEYDVPITPTSVFHVASVSKQFTAYAMVLLARQGKLKLDDDVRKYLPWFPDLQERITIRHLLHHTSGIRDQWQLMAIAGTRLEDVIRQEQIVTVLSRQRALNSKPGERFNYCNSGYTMMAEIVKSVTGQTLRQFMDSAVFKPLGMRDTHFHDHYAEIVKGRTYSYRRSGPGNAFVNVALSYSNAGATSLFTTVNDLAKWAANFYDPKVGDQKDIAQLIERGRLNSGKEIDYALGIANFRSKGWQLLTHGGSDAGYRTVLSVYPEAKMGFIVLANAGDANPGARAEELAALFLPDRSEQQPRKAADSSVALLANAAAMKKFEGRYISDEGTQMAFRLDGNRLYADAFGRSDLLKEEKGAFSTLRTPAAQFVFNIRRAGDTTVLVTFSPGETALLQKVVPVPATPQRLQEYVGKYYCPELDCSYGIELQNNQLVLTSLKYDNKVLQLEGPDHLLNDAWWMDHLKVTRNAQKQITGFEVNSGRVLGLRFNKL